MKTLEAIDDLRDAYLECRTFGHAWFEEATQRERMKKGWWLTLRCERCRTLREVFVDFRTGESEGNRYSYPEGYRLDEKVTRSEFRRELGQRRNYDFISDNRAKRRRR